MSSLVYIASDHRGFALKAKLITFLKDRHIDVCDLGPEDETRCDASDYAVKLALAMKDKEEASGILICGSGQAMSVAANRFSHIRAALCTNATMARLCRAHICANVMTLGASITGDDVVFDCVEAFMKTPLGEGRYAARAKKLSDIG